MRKQKSAFEFGFRSYDRMRLQKAMKSVGDKRSFVRFQAVLLVATGSFISEAAAIVQKPVQRIYAWIKWYLARHWVEDLLDKSRTGRPLAGKAISNEAILAALRLQPHKLACRTAVWTVALLAHYLSHRYKTSISERTLRRRMKVLGLRYKRPRYVYSEKDSNRAQKKGVSQES